ncbi:cellulase family glycosylhydrolase, partial [Herbiconiux sp. P18]|uniref:cellulase family glycosylhydrolase n=1 Tax=Herbiconiux liangxiaofengii TaxID=3342795 RepID=UPI003CEFCF03
PIGSGSTVTPRSSAAATPGANPGAGTTTSPTGAAAPGVPGGTGASVDPASAAASLPGALHTDGGRIVTADGSTYVIKGISWFGMETSNCAPHGLWSISLDAGLAQIASMGFNTIRLPFSNECIGQSVTTSINAFENPTLVDLTPLELMDAIVQTAKSYGLNVILDRHRPDSAAQSNLWYTDRYPESAWIADWQMLAERYRSEPSVIGVDLHNEPHGEACWGCGDESVDWQAAATRAGNAVLAVNPDLLVIVEGVERQSGGDSTWWGGGLADAGSAPVSLDVADRVVYSPHDYPASIFAQTWFDASDYPANLPGVWDANWGYLAKENIAPVLVGEFGSKLQTESDRQWFESIVAYLATTGMSFSYWSFNPNSGDTGGIVQDDWVTPQAEKVAALAPLIGTGTVVTPHGPAEGPAATGTPSPTGPSTPAPTASSVSPTTTGPRIGGVARDGAPGPGGVPSTPGGTSGPPTAPGTPSPAVPAPGGSGDLTSSWALQSTWDEGYVAELTVTNAGGSTGWTASWADPGATSVVNAWGMTCSLADGVITCTGADWGRSVAPGQTITVGAQVRSTSPPTSPAITLSAR